MFDQTFVNAQAQTRRPWTVAVSLALQLALVSVALIVPLLRTASIELPTKIAVWLPLEKLDLKLKPARAAVQNRARNVPRPVFNLAGFRAPISVPAHIDLSPDAPEIVNALAVAALAGPSLGLPIGTAIQALPTPAPKPQASSAPVRIGGGVQ